MAWAIRSVRCDACSQAQCLCTTYIRIVLSSLAPRSTMFSEDHTYTAALAFISPDESFTVINL